MESVGLIHDIGHPQFGHGGEYALNYCMRDDGGFEGNAQTIRLLTKVEKLTKPAGGGATLPKGLNLTRRCLLAALKYPASYSAVANNTLLPDLEGSPTTIKIIDRKKSKPPKCYFDCDQDVIDGLLQPLSPQDRKEFQSVINSAKKHNKTKYMSLDCSIMNTADDVAYGVHDLEDAVALELLERDKFEKVVDENMCKDFLCYVEKLGCADATYDRFVKALFNGDAGERKHWIGRLVGYFVTKIEAKPIEAFEEVLLQHEAIIPETPKRLLDALKDVVRDFVILGAKVQQLEFKGQQMVVAVFEAMVSNPKSLLPDYIYSRFNAENDDKRVICDYIAGMTDAFLLRTYERLFSPRMGSVFDQL